MTDRPTTPCGTDARPGCGRPIVWTVTADGKRIPLDPRAPVYRLAPDGTATRDHDAMVSHFATCPKVENFSAGGKRP